MSHPVFNALYDQDFIRDPIPKLEQCRRQSPVCHFNFGLQDSWHVFRYADCRYVLETPADFTSDRTRSSAGNSAIQDANLVGAFRNLISQDPPRHTRMRRLANRGFLPGVIRRFQSAAQTVVRECLERALEKREIDLVEEFSVPVTIGMITTILGLPPEDLPAIRRWTMTLALNNGTTIWMKELEERRVRESSTALREMQDYFRDFLAERRRRPIKGDLLSELGAAEVENDRFTPDELESMAILLLLAGNETTTNLITNFIRCLCRFPDQDKKLRKDMSLLGAAVEETLRFEPSIRFLERCTTRRLALAGTELQPDSCVCVWLPAANRDPEVFEHPNEFDIGRIKNPHLAFGSGPHSCLGAALARMECNEAGRALLSTTSRIELAGEPEFAPFAGFNNILSMKVRLHPA